MKGVWSNPLSLSHLCDMYVLLCTHIRSLSGVSRDSTHTLGYRLGRTSNQSLALDLAVLRFATPEDLNPDGVMGAPVHRSTGDPCSCGCPHSPPSRPPARTPAPPAAPRRADPPCHPGSGEGAHRGEAVRSSWQAAGSKGRRACTPRCMRNATREGRFRWPRTLARPEARRAG